jgi:chaperone BCS1
MSSKKINKKRDAAAKPTNENDDSEECVEESEEKPEDEQSVVIDFNFANLSDILNAIDGIQSNHGRILILTTNCIEELDSALLRPGRIDLKVEVGYVDNFILNQFMEKFYKGVQIHQGFKIRDEISSAYLQNLILENLNSPKNVLIDVEKEGKNE